MSSSNMYLELGDSHRELIPSQPVGFDHLPNQLVDHKIRAGFSFNIMCIGETGCGKSSFLDTLFDKQLHLTDNDSMTCDKINLKHFSFIAHEGPVNMTMRISESANYGDFIDKTDYSGFFVNYLESQLKEYYTKKQMVHRNLKKIHDNRVHICFYLIPSSCARLKLVDVITMKAVSQYVNVIPLISKCDALTKEELANFKSIIREQIHTNDIRIYQFPTSDPAVAERNAKMNESMPFGVIAGNSIEMINGKSIRVRKLPWGMVKIDDENHCDIPYLKEMIFRVNMDDIIHKTSKKFYSAYRAKLLKNGDVNNLRISFSSDRLKKIRSGAPDNKSNQEEQLRAAHEQKLFHLEHQYREKLAYMDAEFQRKVQEIRNKKNEIATLDTSTSESKKSKKKH